MLEWFAEFTCGNCESVFLRDRRGLWYGGETLTCPQCRDTLRYDTSVCLILIAELLSRVMPYLYRLHEESLTFDRFVPDSDGVYVAVAFHCKRCDRSFEVGDQQAQLLAERGGAMQCPRCKPVRGGRLLIRELFRYWPALPQAQRRARESGWTIRLVPDDRKSPLAVQPPLP